MPAAVNVTSSARFASPKSVSMDDAALMGVDQGLGGLHDPVGDSLKILAAHRLSFTFLDHLGKAAPLDELHRVIVHALIAADGMNWDDVRVMHVRDGFRFALKPLHNFFVRGNSKTQNL
jgi:hypothetical protein